MVEPDSPEHSFSGDLAYTSKLVYNVIEIFFADWHWQSLAGPAGLYGSHSGRASKIAGEEHHEVRFGFIVRGLTHVMISVMSSVIDQTSKLYGAMPKLTSLSQVKDALVEYERPSDSPEPNSTTQSGDGEVQREEVRRLTEAGLDYYNDGKLEEAAECFRKTLKLRNQNKVALYNLGVISGELKRYEESKAAFQRLVRLLEDLGDVVDARTMASARQGLGAALLGLWSTTGSEEPPLEFASESELEFRRAVALDPNCFGAWVGLGCALHILERLDDAEAAFRRALEIDPDIQVAKERLRSVLEDKLERRLFELGYLSRINKPIRDFTPYENRTPIRVEGQPVSEIIVEERR